MPFKWLLSWPKQYLMTCCFDLRKKLALATKSVILVIVSCTFTYVPVTPVISLTKVHCEFSKFSILATCVWEINANTMSLIVNNVELFRRLLRSDAFCLDYAFGDCFSWHL